MCLNYLMHLPKLSNVFVQIAQCICLNCPMCLSQFSDVFVKMNKYICSNCKSGRRFNDFRQSGVTSACHLIVQIINCICLNCQIYICLNYLMYFSKLPNVFVLIVKCIYLNCPMCLSQF